MKYHFIILCILSFNIGYTQNYIDIIHTENTNTPQNEFESQSNSSDSISSELKKIHVNLTLPVPLKNQNTLITGIVYDRINTRFTENSTSIPVSSIILKTGINVSYSDKWSALYILLPKIASSFENKITRSDFQIGGLGIAKKKKNDFLSYKFGAYFNGDLFGPFLVPLFGFYYKKEIGKWISLYLHMQKSIIIYHQK